MAAENPTADLTITVTANGCHRYELFVGQKRIWLTHSLPTVVGRDGAKARMQRWLAQHPHEVVMVGMLPPVTATPTDEQEIAFWREFELVLGGRLWSKVEELLGKQMPRPTTISGWNKLFQAVDQALKAQTASQEAAVA